MSGVAGEGEGGQAFIAQEKFTAKSAQQGSDGLAGGDRTDQRKKTCKHSQPPRSDSPSLDVLLWAPQILLTAYYYWICSAAI